MKTFVSAMVIIGTVIGAGFVSGKEIACFFSRFGASGIWASAILIPLFFTAIFVGLSTKNSDTKTKLGKYGPVIFFVTNLIISLAMLSASIYILQEIFPSIPKFVIVAIMFMIQFFVLIKGLKGLSGICAILIPFLLSFLIFVAIKGIAKGGFNNICFSISPSTIFSSIWFCFIYVSGNFLVGFTILGKIGENLSTKQNKLIAFISAFLISLVIYVFNLAILSNPQSLTAEMPIFELFSVVNPTIALIIKIFILFGILTTLFAVEQGLIETINNIKFLSSQKLNVKAFIVCVLVIIGCFFNFGQIVENLYPFMGVLGLIIFLIITIPVKKISPKV